MAGLSMNVGGFGGIASGPAPSYGSAASYGSAHEAAFGPGATVDAPSATAALSPTHPIGLTVWVGAAAVLALVMIRRSLPN